MAETVETTTTTTVKNLEGGTTYFERIKTINTYWRNLPPNFKRLTIGYAALTAGCYAVYNYTDGKNALVDYRAKQKFSQNPHSASSEWNAIKQGIRSYDNFWDALFFPWSISGKIMPSIVLILNPEKQASKQPQTQLQIPQLQIPTTDNVRKIFNEVLEVEKSD